MIKEFNPDIEYLSCMGLALNISSECSLKIVSEKYCSEETFLRFTVGSFEGYGNITVEESYLIRQNFQLTKY